jgi:hypothetical protein
MRPSVPRKPADDMPPARPTRDEARRPRSVQRWIERSRNLSAALRGVRWEGRVRKLSQLDAGSVAPVRRCRPPTRDGSKGRMQPAYEASESPPMRRRGRVRGGARRLPPASRPGCHHGGRSTWSPGCIIAPCRASGAQQELTKELVLPGASRSRAGEADPPLGRTSPPAWS